MGAPSEPKHRADYGRRAGIVNDIRGDIRADTRAEALQVFGERRDAGGEAAGPVLDHVGGARRDVVALQVGQFGRQDGLADARQLVGEPVQPPLVDAQRVRRRALQAGHAHDERGGPRAPTEERRGDRRGRHDDDTHGRQGPEAHGVTCYTLTDARDSGLGSVERRMPPLPQATARQDVAQLNRRAPRPEPRAPAHIAGATQRRDENDRTRQASPLSIAADATVIETTGMLIPEVISAVLLP